MVFFILNLLISSGHYFEIVSCCWRQTRHMLGCSCATGTLGSAPSPGSGLFPCCLESQGRALLGGWARTKVQGTKTFHPGSPSRHIHTEEALVVALLSFSQLSPWAGLMLLWITAWHLSCSRVKCFSGTWTWLVVLWLFLCWEPRLKSSGEKGSFCCCLCVQLHEPVPAARQEQSSNFH